jgi:AraC family transcriptional regulator
MQQFLDSVNGDKKARWTSVRSKTRMRVELIVPASVTEPRLWVEHHQVLALVLRPGSVEWGLRSSEMQRVDYSPGELGLCRRHEGEWVGMMNVQSVTLGISDAALMVACDGISGEVELRPQRKFSDDRLRALVSAVNAERVLGFPSGQLFLDSIEQALAVALVDGYAVRRCTVRTYTEGNLAGGMAPSTLRRCVDFLDAHLESDLRLSDLAREAGVSTSHFLRSFRQSTGKTPYQFLLHRRVQRAQLLMRDLRAPLTEVALASGFADQHHLARVFRRITGVTPSSYRRSL